MAQDRATYRPSEYSEYTVWSALKVIFFLALGVSVNLLGVGFSSFLKSMLFLDTLGTALVAMAYGPIHGAFAGITSNVIGAYFSIEQKDYIAFSTVHLWLAFAWGLLPRLLNGRFSTNIFNNQYSYRRVVFGISILSLIAALGSSLLENIIRYINLDDICKEINVINIKGHFQSTACALSSFFNFINGISISQRLATFTASFVVDVPDKLLSLACTYFIIEKTLPRRRLDNETTKLISTNRVLTTVIVIFIFFIALGFQLYFIAYDDLVKPWLAFVCSMDLIFIVSLARILGKKGWRLSPSRDEPFTYFCLGNRTSDRVFDDLCKIVILLLLLLYLVIVSLNARALSFDILKQNMESPVSVFVVVTIVNYIVLIYGRLFSPSPIKV